MKNSLVKILALLSMQALTVDLLAASFDERSVSIPTHDNLNLEGKISYPASKTEVLPAVLFIHGSGAVDMDTTIPASMTANGHPVKFFADLANTLNEAGAITLRYHKRGVTLGSKGEVIVDPQIWQSMNVDNLLLDIQSALKVLRNDPQVDPDKIFLLGLSEGSVLAPLAAIEDGNIKGLILMSAMARNLKEILYYQLVERNLEFVHKHVDTNHDGVISLIEALAVPDASLPFPVIDRNLDNSITIEELKTTLLTSHHQTIQSMLYGQTGISGDWFQQHFELGPTFSSVEKFKNPILILQGEEDIQTPLSEAYWLADHLKKTAHPDFKLVSFPKLGHMFSPNKQPENRRPTFGPAEPEVLQELQNWIRRF